jgi:hypothetical protein
MTELPKIAMAKPPQGIEKRRSIRAELRIPVTLRWKASDGSAVEERTETRVVNAHGCLLLLKAPVFQGQRIDVVNRNTGNAHGGRVVWCGAIEADGRTQVGVELDAPDFQFWGEQYTAFLQWAALQK